jgi:hypothetical protein
MARPAGKNSEICMGVPPLVYCRAIVSVNKQWPGYTFPRKRWPPAGAKVAQ